MRPLNHLLIMPRIVDQVGDWYTFPLGLPYVSSSLKEKGFSVFTLNLNHIEGPIEEIVKSALLEHDIDLVLTGGLSSQFSLIKHILDTVKAIKPTVTTIVGGGIISSTPEVAMKALENADFGIIGEGELTNVELSHALENNKSYEAIEGIIYKKDNTLVRTPSRKEIENLDAVPFPDYEGFGYEHIIHSGANFIGMNETNTVTMISSRSCPFRCTFCFHTNGKKYRQRSLDNFFKELDYLVEKYGVKYLCVADELFAYDLERVREFCRRIKTYNIKWWAQFRVSDINETLIELVKDANCSIMAFGLESADNRVLKSMKKHITIEQIESALKLVYNSGITIQGNFIFGDVEETVETATNTINWWKEHMHYGINLNFITIYPGTGLYNYACENGIVTDEIEFLKQGCLNINVSKMNSEELKWLAEQIMIIPNTEPSKVESLTFDEQTETFMTVGYCNACGEKNTWSNIKFLTRNALTCEACGQRHKPPVPEEILKTIDEHIESILKTHGKVAFWGINDVFSDFSRSLKAIRHEGVFFIDDTAIKQNSVVNSKTICSPEVIASENIPVVVCAVSSIHTIIAQRIENHYPQVKETLSMVDLIR